MEFQFAGGKTRVRHWGELFGAGSEVSYGETGLGRVLGSGGPWYLGPMCSALRNSRGQTQRGICLRSEGGRRGTP